MTKEKICYYCKKVKNVGIYCPKYQCGKTGETKESFDTCDDWEDYEEK
jgi:hypothetical protein